MPTLNKYRVFCSTEQIYFYTWSENPPSACINNNTHTIDSESITIIDKVATNSSLATDGRLKVKSGVENLFGETVVSRFSPVIQNCCFYGSINSQLYTKLTSNGGTIQGNTNGSEIDLGISSSLYSYSVLRSKKVLKYRPGYSNTCRFNSIFTTPISDCLQFGGVGNNGNDLYFCYSGLEFGVRVSKGGLSEVRELIITNTENSSGKTATLVLNGISYSIPLSEADDNIPMTISEIASTSFPGWAVEQIGNTIIFESLDVGLKNGTFSYSSNGTSTGSFSTLKNGQGLNTTFIPRSSWNGASPMVDNLIETNRNMYEIEYAWYGSGNVVFRIYNSDTSLFEVVHTMKFANSVIEPYLTQPNMFIQCGLASLGSAISKTIRITGYFGGTMGEYSNQEPIHGLQLFKSIPKRQERLLVVLKNRNTVNGYSNLSESNIVRMSISANVDGQKNTRVNIVKNAIFDNDNESFINYKYIDKDNSLVLYDNNCETYTQGTIVDSLFLQNNIPVYLDLSCNKLSIHKGETLSFSAFSEGNSDFNISINIVDDL